ncbi:hypothetical protein PDE_04050 [Penicillium oxalicum 114-2]|uniref:O-acyltransferase n=2 Tax=Penicillium oxalicum TaxID=69781 RepID=S7ZK87_PENO1|nr:hypothetical protein PDE_04050 [Penicillium oxalicum 114-2]
MSDGMTLAMDAPLPPSPPNADSPSLASSGGWSEDCHFNSDDRQSLHKRRSSVSLQLQKTDQGNQFILTATDAALLREILHEAALTEGLSSSNASSASSPFHGFFTLFWLGVAMMVIKVAANNYRAFGTPFGRTEIIDLMLSRDLLVLGITDFVMCWSTIFCWGFQRMIFGGWVQWSGWGWIIQNIWQTLYLAGFIWWTYHRDWPWTHTVFMVLHCLTMLMKQHSYASFNGYCTQPPRRGSADYTGIHATRDADHLLSLSATIDQRTTLNSAQLDTLKSLLIREIDVLSEGLRGRYAPTSQYPRNLSAGNFCEFLMLPTLVYELEYPRTESIDWGYVVEKVIATFATIFVMIVVSQYWIYPVVMRTVQMKEQGWTVQQRLREFPWVLSDLLFPFMMEYLLAFYVIWECVLNALAEITRFADRGFYADWWNSVSWDQFARDWNRPVHNFLLRHVYHSSISSFHLSKVSASLVTFLLSACVHELIMLCIFRRLRGYLLILQMMQLPLVWLSRTRVLRGRRLVGNVFFWLGIFTGPSLLCSLYLII